MCVQIARSCLKTVLVLPVPILRGLRKHRKNVDQMSVPNFNRFSRMGNAPTAQSTPMLHLMASHASRKPVTNTKCYKKLDHVKTAIHIPNSFLTVNLALQTSVTPVRNFCQTERARLAFKKRKWPWMGKDAFQKSVKTGRYSKVMVLVKTVKSFRELRVMEENVHLICVRLGRS